MTGDGCRRLLVCVSVLWCAAMLTAGSGIAAESVRVRASPHADFGRMVFDWQSPVDYQATIEGNVLTLSFERALAADFAAVDKELGDYVGAPRVDDAGTTLRFELKREYGLHHFTLDNSVVIDLLHRRQAAASPRALVRPPTPIRKPAIQLAAEPPPAVAAAPAEPAGPPIEIAEPPAEVAQAPMETAKPPIELAKAPIELAIAPIDLAIAPIELAKAPIYLAIARAEVAEPPLEMAEAPGEAAAIAIIETPTALTGPDNLAATPETPAAEDAGIAEQENDVGYQQSLDGATLIVPFDTPPRAAVFRRAGALWLIFDETVNLDVSALLADGPSLIESVVQLPREFATVMRVKAAPDFYPVASRTESAWEITLRAAKLAPSVPLDVALDRNTDARALIATVGAGVPIRIQDPAVGDVLWVVPLSEPGTGVDRRHDYAEFALLPTAQGVAIEVRSDGLRVRNDDGAIEIAAEDGLRLSSVADHARALGGQASSAVASRLFGSAAMRIGQENFTAAKQAGLQAIVSATEGERGAARMDLARLFLASGFAADALGALASALLDSPDLLEAPDFIALRGASRQFFGDYQGAAEDLNNPIVSDDPELGLWRGALAAASADWLRATHAFARGHHFLTRYPPAVRRRLLLLATDAALYATDPVSALVHITALESFELNVLERDRLTVLRGRLRALEGDDENALRLLTRAAESSDHRARAEAEFARVDLLLRLNRIEPVDAIERLERLRYVWRGDDFEFAVLRRLGKLQLAQNQTRDGLLSLRSAAANFPDHPQSAELTQTMSEVFQLLYLGGGADTLSPVTAIALFDEFRELTPAGADGDRIVRELTDRLVAVDLLGNAAELLEHQLEFRAAGADKANVGAQLAAIYLLDRNAESALGALTKSVQPNLPADLVAERNRLAARAEIARQNDAIALELIANDDTPEATSLRVRIHWRAKQWPATAVSLESLVDAAPPGAASVQGENATNVLNLAVAYLLAGNRTGLDGLRDRFAVAMADTPYASDFRLIAGPDSTAEDIDALRREVAAVDDYQSFMDTYRQRWGDSKTAVK